MPEEEFELGLDLRSELDEMPVDELVSSKDFLDAIERARREIEETFSRIIGAKAPAVKVKVAEEADVA